MRGTQRQLGTPQDAARERIARATPGGRAAGEWCRCSLQHTAVHLVREATSCCRGAVELLWCCCMRAEGAVGGLGVGAVLTVEVLTVEVLTVEVLTVEVLSQ